MAPLLPILLGLGAVAAFALSSKKEEEKKPAPPPPAPNGATAARAERAAKIVKDALASGSADAMLKAAGELKAMGMTEAASQLEAAASKLSSEASATPTTPTSAAITASKAADTVNKAAEAISAPSADAVKQVAKTALATAKAAPPAAKRQARAVLEATKQMIDKPDAKTVATVARAASEVAKASATPETKQAATAAAEATKKLEASPTPQTASAVSAVTSTAAKTAISKTSAPIAEPGRTTYIVLKGDSAWKIAQKITSNGARWKELIAANPQKAKMADGNFRTISEGEVLKLPASWVRAAPAATIRPGEGGATTTPAWVTDLARMKAENPALYESTMKVRQSKDPAVLRRASEIVRAKYPALGDVFLYWAEQAATAAPAATPASTPPAGAPATAPATPPPPTPSTYTVLSGDSAWRIAQKLVGTGTRWKELVAANPAKKLNADGSGNFATLFAGEVLKLPPSWTAARPIVMAAGYWPRPAKTFSAMGMSPIAW